MDTDDLERRQGTMDIGRAVFATKSTTVTLMDALGHKSFVPEMISGAFEADVGVLVVSAREGEFETGLLLEKEIIDEFGKFRTIEIVGQTLEHAILAKSMGVSKMIVAVNKMDDPTVAWSKDRFDQIEEEVAEFLISLGYNKAEDIVFLPISGLFGNNIDKKMSQALCPWWSRYLCPTFFQALNSRKVAKRGDPNGPFRMPIFELFNNEDMETVVIGRVESGNIRVGDSLIILPNKEKVTILALYRGEKSVYGGEPGDNLIIHTTRVEYEEEAIFSGSVLSTTARRVPVVTEFFAKLEFLKQPKKAIFSAGYKAVMHVRGLTVECEIIRITNCGNGEPKTRRVPFAKVNEEAVCHIQVANPICLEKFSEFPQLGRFSLRCEETSIAVGQVIGKNQFAIAPLDSIEDDGFLYLVPIAAFYEEGKSKGPCGFFVLACYDAATKKFQSICDFGFELLRMESFLAMYSRLSSRVIPKPQNYDVVDHKDKPYVWFEPSDVWQLQGDLEISTKHRAARGLVDYVKGLSLCYPRLIRVREDKKPIEATSPKQIAETFQKRRSS
uniref:Eukaryotic peptide chain release factor GTP-binding subunit n=1 Tax=Noccaea caerulescens TaxID=107243 RepID=A0A1J3FYU0_NOCCA